MTDRIRVIGAGLAGCEAAWQIAKAGVPVDLYEMKPKKFSPAHHYAGLAETGLFQFPESGAVGFGCRFA